MSEDCRGIPSQPVFVLSPYCCVLSGEAINTNLKVFGLTRSRLEPTIYCTQGEYANHYTTDEVTPTMMCKYIVNILK